MAILQGTLATETHLTVDCVTADRLTIPRRTAPRAEVWEVSGPPHANIYAACPVEHTRRVVALFEQMPE